MAEITITFKGGVPSSPRERVLAVEATAEGLSRSVGEDPADAILTLLVAAVHIAMQHGEETDIAAGMMSVIGNAVDAAERFFPLSNDEHGHAGSAESH